MLREVITPPVALVKVEQLVEEKVEAGIQEEHSANLGQEPVAEVVALRLVFLAEEHSSEETVEAVLL